ncbi:MAG: cobalamin-dependent protein [Deltaproteobacteria bacterium]|nr:cobalamin-dependent protein [Deltaproteobacteria bacterium]
MSQELTNAMATMKEQEAISIAKDLIKKGEDPLEIFASCRAAMEIVGSRFEKNEYFLPELMMSGEILRQISELLKPLMKEGAETGGKAGRVIIATVQGDIHDIGKDIVVLMLDVNGFDVLDLGIDVPPAKIIEAIKDFKPQVVGLSGFLTVAFDSMKETVEQIKAAGLRDDVKIMIGGGQIDEEIKNYAGADAYGSDAMAAVNLSKNWIGG